MGDLANKRIVLGITGGIAAYKACELARRLGDEGALVQAVMTRGAQQFVTPTSLQALTGQPVFTDAWDARIDNNMAHIELTRAADAIVVAPATAHFIAKVAHGLCDDLLSTMAVARPRRGCPLLLAPAMNVEMWEHPATQRNVAQARDDGVVFSGPASGDQACGEVGFGRMLEPAQILEDVIATLQPKVLQGRRVLLTAGPTFEPIDPVRGLTNLSSGKMGFAIARAAREAGATVTLVAGPCALPTPQGVERCDVRTAAEMLQQVMARTATVDVFIGVAAVADWHVARTSPQKLKKTPDAEPPVLQLVPNPDILAAVAALERPPYCVGFAAESERLLESAKAKRVRKRIPLIVGNIAQDAIGSDASALVLVDDHETVELPAAGKLVQARRLVAEIARRLGGSRAG